MAYTKKPRVLRKKKVVLRKKKVYRKRNYVSAKGVKAIVNNMMKKTCEKKESTVYITDLTSGQIYTDGTNTISSGHYLTSGITFGAGNGTTDTTRIGDEVLITGMMNEFQFVQQSNTTQKIKGRIIFFSPKLKSSLASVSVSNFLNPNTFIYGGSGGANSIYDTMSSRNMDYFGDFKVIRTKNFSVSPDLASTTQRLATTFKCGLKFKKPWKVRFNSSGQVVQGQLYMLVLFDSGNSGSVSYGAGASIAAISKTDTLSGVQWSYYSKTYYIDP